MASKCESGLIRRWAQPRAPSPGTKPVGLRFRRRAPDDNRSVPVRCAPCSDSKEPASEHPAGAALHQVDDAGGGQHLQDEGEAHAGAEGVGDDPPDEGATDPDEDRHADAHGVGPGDGQSTEGADDEAGDYEAEEVADHGRSLPCGRPFCCGKAVPGAQPPGGLALAASALARLSTSCTAGTAFGGGLLARNASSSGTAATGSWRPS